jgi:VWFA-related protein
MRRRTVSIFAAGALALGGVLASQSSPQPQTPAETPAPATGADGFAETVEVTVVNVDVYVTDRQGNRVKGLTKDDFQLFEDKKPVPITNFYAVEDGKLAKESDPPALALVQEGDATLTAPAEPQAAKPAEPPVPDEQKLHLIVYIDNFNLRPFNRNRALRDLRVFLTQNVRQGDRVMLVSYDRELHIRRTFTTDPMAVASAMLELEKVTAHGVHTDSERRDILSAIDEAETIGEVAGRVRTYAESQFNDLEFTLSALKGMVEQLAGLPGRKAILHVSDGLPMRVAEDIYHALYIKFPTQASLLEAQQYDASRRFQELAAQANAHRVTFYTLEATGLRVSSAADASQSNPQLGVQVEQIHFSNLQAPLQMLAEETGGQYAINSNNLLPRLQRIAEDFNTYYSLGYQPAHGGDGRKHDIEVKLKRKDLRVRHREDYRDRPIESKMADGTLAVLRFGTESNPLGVGLRVGGMSPRSDGMFNVEVTVHIPIGKIVLVPRETLHEGRLRVFVAAMDREDRTSEVNNAPVPITVPEDKLAAALKQYYAYTLTLVMRPGPQRVAIGVRDDLGASTSFLYQSVNVGA